MTATKSTRAGEIAECVQIVSRHFGADPKRAVASFASKTPEVVRARIMLWYHLHRCGMSFVAIGRIFGRVSAAHVQDRIGRWRSKMTKEDRLILATLPRITTSLDIVRLSDSPTFDKVTESNGK